MFGSLRRVYALKAKTHRLPVLRRSYANKGFWSKLGDEVNDTLARTSPGLPSSFSAIPVFDDRRAHMADVVQPDFSNLPNRHHVAKLYHFASLLVQDRLLQELMEACEKSDTQLASLNTLDNVDTIVINAPQFHDAMGYVLELVKIPHRTVSLKEVANFPFSPHQTVFFSCTSEKLSDGAVQTLKNFVNAGGQLCCSDYLLESLISKAWPEYLDVSEQTFDKSIPADKHVYVTVPKHCEDLRILDVFKDEPDRLITWCISKKSLSVVVKDEKKVNKLIVSSSDQRLGLIYHFFYGQGQVYYSLPHFYVHDSYIEPPYMYSKKRIFSYISEKGGGVQVLQEVDEYCKRHELSLPLFRSIVTNVEFLLRVLLKQKQVTPGPINLIPPEWMENNKHPLQ